MTTRGSLWAAVSCFVLFGFVLVGCTKAEETADALSDSVVPVAIGRVPSGELTVFLPGCDPFRSVDEVIVRGPQFEDEPLWRITDSGHAIDLDQITLGRTPEGFDEADRDEAIGTEDKLPELDIQVTYKLEGFQEVDAWPIAEASFRPSDVPTDEVLVDGARVALGDYRRQVCS